MTDKLYVRIFTEDRTGGGLQDIIARAVMAARRRANRPDAALLTFSKIRGDVDGNGQLLKRCRGYSLYRRGADRLMGTRCDHAVFVLDGYRAWDLKELGVTRPAQDPPAIDSFVSAVRAAMTRLAREGCTGDWEEIADGFHPHVLLWERESLLLPVLDALGLGPPILEERRNPARDVADRFAQHSRNGSRYAKGETGRLLLARVAEETDLRERVLAANASLGAIVEKLAAL